MQVLQLGLMAALFKAHKVLPAHKALMAHKAPLASRVIQALKAWQASRVTRVIREQLAPLAQQLSQQPQC